MKLTYSLRALLATAAVVALVGGLAYATTTGRSTVTVKACTNAHHRLQLLQRNGTCPAGYHKISINQQGPVGPSGAPGSRGPSGSPGPSGPAGPGAWTVKGESTTSTTSFQDHALPALHLNVHVVCGAGSSSAVYLEQVGSNDVSDYTVEGSALLGAGGSAKLIYFDGGIQNTALAAGTQLVTYRAQFDGDGAASEIVDDSGDLTGDVVVTRGGQSASIHFNDHQAPGLCVTQAVVTPLT